MHEKWRHRLLGWWAAMVCDHPWWIVAIACLLSVGAVILSVRGIEFQSDRTALLNPESQWSQRFERYLSRFAGDGDVIAVVSVPDIPQGTQKAKAYADALAHRLQKLPEHIEQVYWRIDTQALSQMAMRLVSSRKFEQRLDQIAQARTLLKAESPSDLLSSIVSRLRSGQSAKRPSRALEQLTRLTQLVDAVGDVLSSRAAEGGTRAFASLRSEGRQRWIYLGTDDGELLILRIDPKTDTHNLNRLIQTLRLVRREMSQLEQRFPRIEAGLTGFPVLAADEKVTTSRDMTRATIIAIVGIAVLLIAAFHSFRMPLLAVGALLMGFAWTFGFVALTIGHLQVLSAAFTSILLGLGIDFGVHLISQFERVRHEHGGGRHGFRRAMIRTFESTGPGIITGAVTTAAAFWMTMVTDFHGMAEMGLIAGAGIIFCLLAMLTVLPAMMRLVKPRAHQVRPMHRRVVNFHAIDRVLPFAHRPWWTVGGAAVVVAAAAATIPQLHYDFNLLNLQAEGAEAVIWQHKLVEHSDRAIWAAVSVVDDLQTARRLASHFRALPTVSSVGGIGMLFPPDLTQRKQALTELRRRMSDAFEPPTSGAASAADASLNRLRAQLRALSLGLSLATGRANVRDHPAIHQAISNLRQEVREVRELLASAVFQQHKVRRIARLQQAFSQWRARVSDRIERLITWSDPKPAALPPVLRRGAISRDGRSYALKIYPSRNIWNPKHLRQFVIQLRRVDPKITGTPVQMYESGLLITRSYQLAGLLALAVVLILVYIDFQALPTALLSLLPVSIGFVTMFGIMWLAGVPLNPANVIALPLLFGIGVDSGVHMLHRDRRDPDDHPPGLGGGTGKGVFLTGATTIIGFGSLMIARHQGIQTLGFVLTAGMGMTLLACLIVMPAALELRHRFHRRRARRTTSIRASESGDSDSASESEVVLRHGW